jgi:ATP-dependent protease ClpP protease subunit
MAESGSSKTYKMLEELEKIEGASVNPETREIYLEDIEETTGLWFVRVVNYLSEQNYEPIRIYLNTPGGDVISSFVIHDRIHDDPDITFKVMGTGNVCSAGVLILACADERYVTESCMWMTHQASGFGSWGLRLDESQSRRDADDWMESHWCKLMARYTPKTAKQWAKITKDRAEWWLLGGEAIVKEGLADEVV